jgi:hypothetical protein
VESTTGDGARDAEVNRVLGVLDRVAVWQAPDEVAARRAGRLRFLAGSPAILLTSDLADLERLLERETHVHVRKV